jgi:hypothetical protein
MFFATMDTSRHFVDKDRLKISIANNNVQDIIGRGIQISGNNEEVYPMQIYLLVE